MKILAISDIHGEENENLYKYLENNDIDLVIYDRDVDNNDIIVMCSDGILESNTEYENKEIWLKNLLEKVKDFFYS